MSTVTGALRIPARRSRKRSPLAAPTLAALLAAALTGCASCPQDPTQAGFYCGVANQASGVYDQRQAALASEAAVASDAADQARFDAARISARADSLGQQRASLAAQVSALRQRTGALSRSIAQARLQRAASQDELSQLEARIRELDLRIEDLKRTDPAPTVSTVAKVDDSVKVLEDRINAILAKRSRI